MYSGTVYVQFRDGALLGTQVHHRSVLGDVSKDTVGYGDT